MFCFYQTVKRPTAVAELRRTERIYSRWHRLWFPLFQPLKSVAVFWSWVENMAWFCVSEWVANCGSSLMQKLSCIMSQVTAMCVEPLVLILQYLLEVSKKKPKYKSSFYIIFSYFFIFIRVSQLNSRNASRGSHIKIYSCNQWSFLHNLFFICFKMKRIKFFLVHN